MRIRRARDWTESVRQPLEMRIIRFDISSQNICKSSGTHSFLFLIFFFSPARSFIYLYIWFFVWVAVVVDAVFVWQHVFCADIRVFVDRNSSRWCLSSQGRVRERKSWWRKVAAEDIRKEYICSLLRFLFIAFEIVFCVVYGCSRNDRINSVCAVCASQPSILLVL